MKTPIHALHWGHIIHSHHHQSERGKAAFVPILSEGLILHNLLEATSGHLLGHTRAQVSGEFLFPLISGGDDITSTNPPMHRIAAVPSSLTVSDLSRQQCHLQDFRHSGQRYDELAHFDADCTCQQSIGGFVVPLWLLRVSYAVYHRLVGCIFQEVLIPFWTP